MSSLGHGPITALALLMHRGCPFERQDVLTLGFPGSPVSFFRAGLGLSMFLPSALSPGAHGCSHNSLDRIQERRKSEGTTAPWTPLALGLPHEWTAALESENNPCSVSNPVRDLLQDPVSRASVPSRCGGGQLSLQRNREGQVALLGAPICLGQSPIKFCWLLMANQNR